MKKARQEWWIKSGKETEKIARKILRVLTQAEGRMGHTALKKAVLGEDWWPELGNGFDYFDMALGLLLGLKRIRRSHLGKGMKYWIRDKEDEEKGE